MRPGPQAKSLKHGSGGATMVDVVDTPYTGPRPQLPPTPGMHWFPQVEAWWEILTTMPHCLLWTPSDWLAAVELAFLKNQFWAEYFGGSPTVAMSTEIRRREDNMGMTMEARRKLGIRYVPPTETSTSGDEDEQRPETDEAGNVADITKAPSRRARLAG